MRWEGKRLHYLVANFFRKLHTKCHLICRVLREILWKTFRSFFPGHWHYNITAQVVFMVFRSRLLHSCVHYGPNFTVFLPYDSSLCVRVLTRLLRHGQRLWCQSIAYVWFERHSTFIDPIIVPIISTQTPCVRAAKTGMVRVWVTGKTVWSHVTHGPYLRALDM